MTTNGETTDSESGGGESEEPARVRESAAGSEADDEPVTGPAPALSPEQAVRAQLESIRAATESEIGDRLTAVDSPALRTLFEFAAPAFRQQHGSLSAFATALSGPIHERLLGATAIERGPLEHDSDRATLAVLARHPSGDQTYEFVLEKQAGGKYADCWMTVAIDLIYNGVSPSFRRMPTVRFGDRELKCDEGERLRDVLLRIEGHSPHNEVAQVANCGGNGLCGTCAVEVDGETDEPGPREQTRLSLPPHDGSDQLRLSCQTVVRGDIEVAKHEGLWGQHIDERTAIDDEPPEPIEVTAAEYEGSYEYDTTTADNHEADSGSRTEGQ